MVASLTNTFSSFSCSKFLAAGHFSLVRLKCWYFKKKFNMCCLAPQYIYKASYPPVFWGWWPFLIKTDINKTFEPLKNARSHPDPVSSHVLDTTLGLPARNLTLTLYTMEDDQVWTKLQHR